MCMWDHPKTLFEKCLKIAHVPNTFKWFWTWFLRPEFPNQCSPDPGDPGDPGSKQWHVAIGNGSFPQFGPLNMGAYHSCEVQVAASETRLKVSIKPLWQTEKPLGNIM